jgi:hypothetical protein
MTTSQLVRQALLQRTKDDIFQWFTGWATLGGAILTVIFGVFALLGLIGINELVTNRVNQKVGEQINEIKDDIRSSKRELDMAIREQRAKLDQEVEALRIERDKIVSILKETSFVVALHKLRYDLYRMRSLELRTIIVLPKGSEEKIAPGCSQVRIVVSFGSIKDMTSHIQFGSLLPCTIIHSKDKSEEFMVMSRHDMAGLYIERLIGQPIDKLNDIDIVQIESPFLEYKITDEVDKDLVKNKDSYMYAITRIHLKLTVNGVLIGDIPIDEPKFSLHENVVDGNVSRQIRSGVLHLDDWFRNVRSRYEKAILQSDE